MRDECNFVALQIILPAFHLTKNVITMFNIVYIIYNAQINNIILLLPALRVGI